MTNPQPAQMPPEAPPQQAWATQAPPAWENSPTGALNISGASAAQYHPSSPSYPGYPGYAGDALYPAKFPLLRPKKGRWLAGVCKGVSMHLGVHVAWIRLITIALTVAYGAGALGYVLLWMLIPAGNPEEAARIQEQKAKGFQGPLAKGNAHDYTGLGAFTNTADEEDPDATEGALTSSESLQQTLAKAPKPALFAFAALALVTLAILIANNGTNPILLPALTAFAGVGIAWLRFNADQGQAKTMVIGMCLIFVAYASYMFQVAFKDSKIPLVNSLVAGILLLLCATCALVPWIVSLIRNVGTERALKEREEERADMTAHLHDGVLQTLALIQLHSSEPQQVFTLARSQERELRNWLYQERVPTDRSVSAGLKEIAAEVEDTLGKPIEVVCVSDAEPSAQTDALLDAARQAMVNAVTHGREPVSVYCESNGQLVEIFVRDHGDGFDVDSIPENRLGIRQSIVGRMERRGGKVEIVSRANWGTEVRMHMPVAHSQSAHNSVEERNGQ